MKTITPDVNKEIKAITSIVIKEIKDDNSPIVIKEIKNEIAFSSPSLQ
jgi:hypothetical protein